MKEKVLSTIGLCRRAGKLMTGFDAVTQELKREDTKIKGVLLAYDLSEKTKKEVGFFCGKAGVELSEPDISTEEIKSVLGKKTGILAVLDEGLFKSITKNK